MFLLIIRIACDYLAILIAEVDIKRLFNDRRNILDIRRWTIQGTIIRVFILLKDELKRRK
jgi:hypothetical protein